MPPNQAYIPAEEDTPISLGAGSKDSSRFVQHITVEILGDVMPNYVKRRKRKKTVKIALRKKIVDINYNSCLPTIQQTYSNPNPKRGDPLFFRNISG